MPAIIDAVVMMIGRKRSWALCPIAVTRSTPRANLVIREVDEQDAVLGDEPDEQHRSDQREEVERSGA